MPYMEFPDVTPLKTSNLYIATGAKTVLTFDYGNRGVTARCVVSNCVLYQHVHVNI